MFVDPVGITRRGLGVAVEEQQVARAGRVAGHQLDQRTCPLGLSGARDVPAPARLVSEHHKRRWVVERTLAWLSKCQAILVRYAKKSCNHLGLVKVACILLWFRRTWRRGAVWDSF